MFYSIYSQVSLNLLQTEIFNPPEGIKTMPIWIFSGIITAAVAIIGVLWNQIGKLNKDIKEKDKREDDITSERISDLKQQKESIETLTDIRINKVLDELEKQTNKIGNQITELKVILATFNKGNKDV